MVKVGKMMWKMMVKANCSRERMRASKSMGSVLEPMSASCPQSFRSFGRSCRREFRMTGGPALRKLLFEPQVVMLLGPVVIDLAGAHGLERALHSKRADIDVTEDQGDEQDGDDAVHDLRDLHSGDVGDVEREQQQKARCGNQRAGTERAPEHQLFAGVEPARRSVPRLDEAAALLEPFNVDLVGDVVLDKDHDDQREAEHERKGHEIVRVFGGLRERAEGIRSDQWQQQPLSEGDVQPGNPENAERGRRQPVGEPLERIETRYFASGSSG